MRGLALAVMLLLLVVAGWFVTRSSDDVPAPASAPAGVDRAPMAPPASPASMARTSPESAGSELPGRMSGPRRGGPPPDPLTTTAVYPLHPQEIIASSLDRAADGDAAAQWRMYLAFDECAFAPQTEQALQDAIHGINDPLFARDQRWRYERCRDVLAEYPDTKSERRKWHALSVAGGYPPAVLDAAVASSAYSYRSEVDELPDDVIVAALRTGQPRALLNVKMLTSRLPEAERETRTVVWELLECRAAGGCRADVLMDVLSARWLPHELDEIVAQADRIEAAIASGDFSGVQIP